MFQRKKKNLLLGPASGLRPCKENLPQGTVLSPGVIKIRGFLVYDITAVLEGVIMWEGGIRSQGGDVFIGKTHGILSSFS